MRITLDTSIVIAGLYSRRGASYQLLRLAVGGELDYALSPLLALEYEGKVAEKVREEFIKLSLDECRVIIQALVDNSFQIARPVLMRPMLIDASDDKVVECAIGAHCSGIVTFNKRHFSVSELVKYGIQVFSPGEFYEKEVKSR